MSLITYEAIRAVQRAEQAEQLQKLPDHFFEAVKNWIAYKRNKNDELSRREIESAKQLLKDIINRRQRKLLTAALRTARGDIPPHDLPPTETKFFDKALILINSFRGKMGDQILNEDTIAEKAITDAMDSIKQINENSAGPEIIETKIPAIEPTPESSLPIDHSSLPTQNPSLPNTHSQAPLPASPQAPEITPTKETIAQTTKDHTYQNKSSLLEPTKTITPAQESSLLTQTKGEPKLLFGPAETKNGLKLLTDLPKFVGSDLKPYGPFKSGEIVTLPDEIKNLLLKRNVAEAC
jgi:DNA replication initiation complex subunit (GINS family)